MQVFLAEGATDTVRGASAFVRTCPLLSVLVEAFDLTGEIFQKMMNCVFCSWRAITEKMITFDQVAMVKETCPRSDEAGPG